MLLLHQPNDELHEKQPGTKVARFCYFHETFNAELLRNRTYFTQL